MFEVCTGRAIPTAISILHYAVRIDHGCRLCIEVGKPKQRVLRASVTPLPQFFLWRKAYGPSIQASDDSFMKIVTIELGLQAAT